MSWIEIDNKCFHSNLKVFVHVFKEALFNLCPSILSIFERLILRWRHMIQIQQTRWMQGEFCVQFSQKYMLFKSNLIFKSNSKVLINFHFTNQFKTLSDIIESLIVFTLLVNDAKLNVLLISFDDLNKYLYEAISHLLIRFSFWWIATFKLVFMLSIISNTQLWF